ncbi:MAG TPA: hypothetical protein IAB55_07240 [Candidatus Merdivicinus faecavium]|nr:hypothetical protein [Candidatus Merdivicinus faecavium]
MTPPYANETTRTSLLRAFSLLAAAGLGVLLFLPWGQAGASPLCPLSLWLESAASPETSRLASLLFAAGTCELILLLLAGLLLLCPLRERALLRLIPLCYGAALILPAGLLWCAAVLPDMLSVDWRVLIAQLGCALAGIALSRHYARS